MNRIKNLVCAFFLLGAAAAPAAAAKLRIVATTPDLADVTRQVGGDFVVVDSLAKGTEDVHAVPQRPSFIPKLHRADGVVLLGFDAEHAFLPALLEVAQNPNILYNHVGYIDCSKYVTPEEVPTIISRAEGEQHPLGNPHYNFDPRNGGHIADAIAEGLKRLDPAHAAQYDANRAAFEKELDAKIADWRKIAEPIKGKKAVSYHPSMTYFAGFLGLDMIGTIELKPGIAPTPRHLQELVGKMKAEKCDLILREVQYSNDTAAWLAGQTGAKIAVVATMGGAFPDSKTYFGMIDHNIHAILDALKGS